MKVLDSMASKVPSSYKMLQNPEYKQRLVREQTPIKASLIPHQDSLGFSYSYNWSQSTLGAGS